MSSTRVLSHMCFCKPVDVALRTLHVPDRCSAMIGGGCKENFCALFLIYSDTCNFYKVFLMAYALCFDLYPTAVLST